MDGLREIDLTVAPVLRDFIEQEVLPGTGLDAGHFWRSLRRLIALFAPRNALLLQRRDALQVELDTWHRANRGRPIDPVAYADFLKAIGYLQPDPPAFAITTANVDAEIAHIAGPQLVVPVDNARYALNAANARWGSLYDALYGTDAIPDDAGAERTPAYNPARGEQVVARARELLDSAAPLGGASHADGIRYSISDGRLCVACAFGGVGLAKPEQLVGWHGEAEAPSAILLRHNGLHLELKFDRNHPIGRDDPAGIADVVIESAITTIMDCEDSIAAVDAADKVRAYRN